MIVKGCAESIAYMNPHAAVEDTISIVPIAPFVAVANNPPNPTAGARQAKNRNSVAARHYEECEYCVHNNRITAKDKKIHHCSYRTCVFNPSLKSEP